MLAVTVMSLQAQTARKFTVNITPDGKANMVCYLPENPSGRAVVDLPGGGYTHLAVDHEGHDWAEWFNRQGIAFFVVTYRMPGGDRTIPMGDAQQAIRIVRDSAQTWAVNPYDVGIMGFSAGGHLASTVSTHSEFDARPDFSILFYPVISMNERETHSGSVNGFLGKEKNNKNLVRRFSNQNACEMPAMSVPFMSTLRVVTVSVSDLPISSMTRCSATSLHGSATIRLRVRMPSVWLASAIASPTAQALTCRNRKVILHSSNDCWAMTITCVISVLAPVV